MDNKLDKEIIKVPANKIVSGGLKSIAASFPVFASIGQAWSEYENYRTIQRVQELIDNLKTEVGNLYKHVDNIEERLNKIAEEFPSLLEITIDKVKKEFSEEKRKIYAHVLVSLTITDNIQNYDERTALLHELEALTPLDLNVLKSFKDKDTLKAKHLGLNELCSSNNIDINTGLDRLASILAKLESRGLILTTSSYSSVVNVPRGMERWSARWMDTEYRILNLGKQLLSVLD